MIDDNVIFIFYFFYNIKITRNNNGGEETRSNRCPPWSHEDCLRVHRQSQTEGRKDARANMESLPHLKQPRVRINAESVFENLAYEAKAGHP